MKEKQLVQFFFFSALDGGNSQQIDSATRNHMKILNYIVNQFVFRGLGFSV